MGAILHVGSLCCPVLYMDMLMYIYDVWNGVPLGNHLRLAMLLVMAFCMLLQPSSLRRRKSHVPLNRWILLYTAWKLCAVMCVTTCRPLPVNVYYMFLCVVVNVDRNELVHVPRLASICIVILYLLMQTRLFTVRTHTVHVYACMYTCTFMSEVVLKSRWR